MLTTIRDVFSKLEKQPFFLHNVVRLYRFLRVFCCLIEDRYRGVSEDAGFKVAIAWTEELGFDREAL